jgi:anti-sigma B factor antagonist
MSTFSTRDESDALVIVFDNAAGLNDFRNNALRDALYEMVQGLSEPRVAIDLLKVDYLSSSGVAILVGLKRRIDTRNGKLALFHVLPVVRDLLHVMKLDKYFPIAEDEHSALAAVRPVSTI